MYIYILYIQYMYVILFKAVNIIRREGKFELYYKIYDEKNIINEN